MSFFCSLLSQADSDLINLRPSEEGEAAFEELERTFATLDFNDVFQKMEITNAGIFSPSVKVESRTHIISNTGLELPRMKLDFSANLKTPLEDIGELLKSSFCRASQPTPSLSCWFRCHCRHHWSLLSWVSSSRSSVTLKAITITIIAKLSLQLPLAE